jgi:hypothetical protein
MPFVAVAGNDCWSTGDLVGRLCEFATTRDTVTANTTPAATYCIHIGHSIEFTQPRMHHGQLVKVNEGSVPQGKFGPRAGPPQVLRNPSAAEAGIGHRTAGAPQHRSDVHTAGGSERPPQHGLRHAHVQPRRHSYAIPAVPVTMAEPFIDRIS